MVEDMIKIGRAKFGGTVIDTDTFSKDDNISFKIDYSNDSSTAPGGKSKGSIYIRGVKGKDIDSYKFVMEKGVDFCDLDVQIFVNILTEVNRLLPPKVIEVPQAKSAVSAP
jgi:hypothetical protein